MATTIDGHRTLVPVFIWFRYPGSMKRSAAVLLSLALTRCSTSDPTLWPATVSQRGGVDLYVRIHEHHEGGVIVLVDGLPAHSVVLEGPKLLRARLPALPRAGRVDVEVLFEDGTVARLERAIHIVALGLEVRARDSAGIDTE